jgi:F-type H+-transporting ATPase subunit c
MGDALLEKRMNKIAVRLITFLGTLFVAIPAFAQDGAAAGGQKGWYALGAALAIGLAAAGGGMGQGRAAASALEGIARNPGASGKVFVPMILALAMTESLVLFAFLIAFFLYGKI